MATHNGYTNYVTWSVIATIDNTESLYNFFKDLVKEVKEKNKDKDKQLLATMSILKNCVENMKPTTNNPIWQPIIDVQINEYINFREIALSLLESY